MKSKCSSIQFFMILCACLIVCSTSFSSKENENDRRSLMALRDGFIGNGGIPPDGSRLNSWNTSLHFCQWGGVICGKRHKRVTMIDLVEQKLDGFLSTSIGNLTFLRKLSLYNNSLRGEIPTEIGKLKRLRYLYLDRNSIQGKIPVELSNCSYLLEMWLSFNNITGRIPLQFGSLLNLTMFHARGNNLMGEIPFVFRNLSSLRSLHLDDNHFHGEIGNFLQGLSKLTYLTLWSNNFSGMMLPLYNVSSSIEALDLANNQFRGALEQDMDIAFPKLNFLSLSGNHFNGPIPSSFANISSLTVLQLSQNNFSGRVPANLGKLENLRLLSLFDNSLGSGKSNDLKFIDSLTNCTKLERLGLQSNMFTGSLPDSVANLTYKLQWFTINENYITGSIPEGIGELSGLTVLSLGSNLFTGTIPKSIGKLTNVSLLEMSANKLHGKIPTSIGNLTRLYGLDLSYNSLDGIISTSLGNCGSMQIISVSRNLLSGHLPEDVFSRFQALISCDLSYNSFDGIFPTAFGKLIHLSSLYASGNKFYGEIPSQLGDLSSLEYLMMAQNFFKGSIPKALGRLRALRGLDLSYNNLSGAIPESLVEIRGLQYLNLSFNHLEDEVPLFQNVTEFSIEGNNGLCGGNPDMHLHPCFRSRTMKPISRKAIIAISLSLIALFSMFILLCIFFCYRTKYKKDLTKGYQGVTYADLFKATEGFSESNLIGSGNFGFVYRGILDGNEGKMIAVKVLNLSRHGGVKSFKTECEVLRRIRHKNVLKTITSCSSLDYKGNDFKALVFNFMLNGSLDNRLHFSNMDLQEETRILTLVKRLEIAIDVGYALDYLHNYSEIPIVHCDMKPSNILLDEDMVAHVSDFGIAKMFQIGIENLSGGESLSTAVKGSIGYIPPEYGMGATISPQGDIYSYGIILLELMTGKRPTADKFNNEMSLRTFCERALPDHIHDVIDKGLVNEIHEATPTLRNPEEFKIICYTLLTSFIEVGLSCSMESPRDRMDIQSCIKCLKRIKEKYDKLRYA